MAEQRPAKPRSPILDRSISTSIPPGRSPETSPTQDYWITGESKTRDVEKLPFDMIPKRTGHVNGLISQACNYVYAALPRTGLDRYTGNTFDNDCIVEIKAGRDEWF